MAMLQGEQRMSDNEYFDGFEERQYEDEARERWGDDPKYAQSQRRWTGYSEEQKEAIKAEGGHLTIRMVGEDPDPSPEDEDIQEAIAEYHAYLNKYFYTCDVRFLRRLADGWAQDPRFAVNYERIRVGGAEFVREAVHVYCDRQE
jgi:hypothetical protein